MFDRLNHIIKKTKTIPNSLKQQKKLTMDLVARYSNGNVNLQRSSFITKEQLIKKEKEIFSHKFI